MDNYKERCKNCLFGDVCSSDAPCDDYAPLVHTDEHDGEYIEKQRYRFRREWWYYLLDNQDGDCEFSVSDVMVQRSGSM